MPAKTSTCLGDEPDGPADLDRASCGRLQTGRDARDRRLARPGGADQRDALAGRDLQVDPVQHRVLFDVGMMDGGERDFAGVAGLRLPRRGVERHHAREARERGRRLLEVVDEHEEHAHGVERAVEVQRGGGRLADGGVAGADEQEAGDQHARQADQLAAVHRAAEAIGLQPRGAQGGVDGGTARRLDLLEAERAEPERS